MPKPTTKKSSTGRDIVYAKITTQSCVGDKAITMKQAKTLLGWEEEPAKVEWGKKVKDDFLLRDRYGRKVRCHNNINNRPFDLRKTNTYVQEHLRKNWHMNLENIKIGKTKVVLDGQKRLVALVLAVQEWQQNREKWDNWKTEPVMETSIGFGLDETDEDMINTMDTGDPRTLADVLYRSPYFADTVPSQRNKLARDTDYAIRLLWGRTGVKLSAYAPVSTHGEAMGFLERHPRIVKCVRHIYEENEDNRIRNYLTPGYASGMLYLMASSDTDPAEYWAADDPNEDLLDWSRWEEACKYWVLLAGGAEEVKAVTSMIQKMCDDETVSPQARVGVLSKAWNLFAVDKPVTVGQIKLEYETDAEGWSTLVEFPSVGGIDRGNVDDADKTVCEVPTPEEIEARAKEERAKAQEAKTKVSAKKKTTKKTTRKKSALPYKLTALTWVAEPDVDAWQGRIVELTGDVARVKVGQGFQGAGNTKVIPIAQLRRTQPQ